MNYGLIIEEPKPEDYIFGGQKLGDTPIQPDADWSGYLPDVEIQNKNGIEPYACVSFTVLTCVEILERKIYGATRNWSDRFLATVSGTKERKGNKPNTVSETLKEEGCVEEKELPFDETITSYDKFYATISNTLKTLALQFKAEYSFGYEYVPSNPDSLMEALTYSPVGFSVCAWYRNDDGIYYRPEGERDNHFTTCYGYKRNEYWLIFDTYTDSGGSALKKVKWDSLPQQAYRFTLNRQIVEESAFQKFIYWLRKALGL